MQESWSLIVKARLRNSFLGCWLALAILSAGCGESPVTPPAGRVRITFPEARELSGLAASHRSGNLLWVHNDSGSPPVLYAITPDGKLAGRVRIKGARNFDWEDIASFELDGKAWLLVADTGDNTGRRKNCSFLVIEEPAPAALSPSAELTVPLAWKVPFVYPDGPHDCEAAAVDPRAEKIYFITKRTQPPCLFSVPLRPAAGSSPVMAERLAVLREIPQPTTFEKLIPSPTGRHRAQVTGLDFAPDFSRAAVLTYGDVLLYSRRPGEDWALALSRPPQPFAVHGLPQAEAICFSLEGKALYVTGETAPPEMRRYLIPAEPKP